LANGDIEVVYNLRVADRHTYFVGAHGGNVAVLVHNTSISGVFSGISDKFTSLTGGAMQAAGRAYDATANAVGTAYDATKNFVNNTADEISQVGSAALQGVKNGVAMVKWNNAKEDATKFGTAEMLLDQVDSASRIPNGTSSLPYPELPPAKGVPQQLLDPARLAASSQRLEAQGRMANAARDIRPLESPDGKVTLGTWYGEHIAQAVAIVGDIITHPNQSPSTRMAGKMAEGLLQNGLQTWENTADSNLSDWQRGIIVAGEAGAKMTGVDEFETVKSGRNEPGHELTLLAKVAYGIESGVKLVQAALGIKGAIEFAIPGPKGGALPYGRGPKSIPPAEESPRLTPEGGARPEPLPPEKLPNEPNSPKIDPVQEKPVLPPEELPPPAPDVGPAARTARLTTRAEEVHSVLDPIARNERTTAVLETTGGDIIGGGVRDLTPAQRALLGEGEIAARLPGEHAEITVLQEAARRGLTPRAISTTRDFCPDCRRALEEAGARITGPRTAVWD
jgi:hypothetical protein